MSPVRIIDTHTWAWRDEGCTEYQGTKEDLLEVGVAWPEVFEDVGKSGTKTRGKWAGISSLEATKNRYQYFIETDSMDLEGMFVTVSDGSGCSEVPVH